MDALLMAKKAAECFEEFDNADYRITAIMYALIALAEQAQAQTPATVMVGRDIAARWAADGRYSAFINAERAAALAGENVEGV